MDLKAFLNSKYESQKFETFLIEHFHGFAVSDSGYDNEYLSDSDKEDIRDYRYLGHAELDDGKEIGFFEFRSTSPRIENKRVGYNAILKKFVKNNILDGAIASFYYPDGEDKDAWRLSFVGIDYDIGKNNVTNLKRYTYVLGKDVPIQTPLEQLKDFKYPNMYEIEKAFSVERVSKEFFEKYKNLYLELSDYLQSQIAYFGNEKNLNLFTKKLLGRVVFLYFIQKKGWFGSKEEWGTGNKRFLSEFFFEKCHYENFYFEILQPIFFEALNEKREDDYFTLLDCKMPFLNGGLFSRDEFDKKDIIIDNTIFKDIFTTFDQYNFTIIEDNPNDSEIAIDPEMLGRVFESLLEDRKEKGAFYTPREIVHYMSRNAIEHYLKTEAKDYNYVFSVDEFLHKTSLADDEILQFHTEHPVKFIKIDDYFEELLPYKNLVVDFYIVAKLRGLWIDAQGKRTKNAKGHTEITHHIWHKILNKEYEVVAVNFGSNKEIKLQKTYKYPTILKYIQIEERYYSLAFLPNIWGDLELTTIFPIRYKEIKRKLKKIYKPLYEISKSNFVFDGEVYEKVEELREDCRSLYTEPFHQGTELPQQAVIQVKQGLSTFHNSFTLSSLADANLKALLKDKDYYQKTINKLLNASTLTQHKLKDIMLKKLKQIKVLDPAIGSGAFPMGVLHELVDLRQHLGDTTELVKLKKEIIENSIYGIDIEPSAVEIAKLRFWLSIVVDEDTPTPLPNLFYKIMVGNSLLETVNGFDPLDMQDSSLFGDKYKIGTLQDKFHAYYKEWDNTKKSEIQDEINAIIDEVLDSKLREHEASIESYVKNADIFSFDKKATNMLAKCHEDINLLEKVQQRPTTELFFYKLYFAEVMNAGGFNVIIGNPPYIKEYTSKSVFERMHDLECYQGKMDLWYLFACKGIDLLQDNGILSYIATNNWVSNAGASKFRNKVLQETQIKEFIDFGDYKVFDTAGIQTMIMFLHKTKDNAKYSCDYSKVIDKNLDKSELINILEKKINPKFSIFKSIVESDKLMNQSITFLESSKSFILDKIENNRNFILGDKEVAQGIVGAPDKAFIVQEEDYNSFNDEEKIYLKSFHTNAGKYIANKTNKYIFYSTRKNIASMVDLPNLDEKMIPFLEQLKNRREVKSGQLKYFHLQWSRNEKFFLKGSKIICATRTTSSSCTYTEDEFYGSRALNFIKTDRINLKYLTCILNSKLANFWLKYKGKLTGDLLQVDKSQLLNIPIKNIEKTKPFETIVDYILLLKKEDDKKYQFEIDFFERLIDIMVYELYFEKEIHDQGYGVLELVEDESSEDASLEQLLKLYTHWSDRNHKVAYNVAFIDSLELIQTIESNI